MSEEKQKSVKLKDTGERLIPELHSQSLAYGEHLARYHAAEPLIKQKVVLDIASGAGYGTAFLAQTAKKVIGVDYDKEAIAYAQELYPLKNVEFIVGDAQALPLEDNSIDVVVSLETIEHVPDSEEFVREVVRVLKPEGIFYVSTPNDDEFIEGNKFHVHEFDFEELSRLIKKYFKQAEYYYQGSWYASGVLSERHFEQPADSITAVKTFEQKLDKAIYFLAVASTGKAALPKLTENVIIADRFSELNAQQQHEARVKAEKERQQQLQTLIVNNDSLRAETNQLRSELGNILNSKGWKLLSKAYKVKHILTHLK